MLGTYSVLVIVATHLLPVKLVHTMLDAYSWTGDPLRHVS